MRILLGALVLIGLAALVADVRDFLPLGLGLLCVIWRCVDPLDKPSPQPLRVLLMRNVISRVDRKPPIPVEIRRLYSRRWDAGK